MGGRQGGEREKETKREEAQNYVGVGRRGRLKAALSLFAQAAPRRIQRKTDETDKETESSMGKGGEQGEECGGGGEREAPVPSYTWEEIQKHNLRADKWLVIERKVYNITQWVKRHPGGIRVISHYAGEDATVSALSRRRRRLLAWSKWLLLLLPARGSLSFSHLLLLETQPRG